MTSAELRKIHKPLIEKKRRERINSSLEQLKMIVLESLQKDPSQYSKLEKADILEMTVKYLRSVHTQRNLAGTPTSTSSWRDADAVSKYRAGFAECLQEVNHCLTSIKGLTSESHAQLMAHLANCLRQTERLTPCYSGVITPPVESPRPAPYFVPIQPANRTSDTEVIPKRPTVTKRRRSRPASLPEIPNEEPSPQALRRQSASVQPSCWRPW